MNHPRKTLIVIAGPTAVGKTGLAIAVAKKLKTEIISADSRQFFRELEIGTAKPEATELQEIKHHFINFHSIQEDYDAASFETDALRILTEIFQSRDTAILCGGSGLYINAVTNGFDDIPPVPEDMRQRIIESYKENGITWLQSQMQIHDPEYLKIIDEQNPHRMIRALEVKLGTGKSLSSYFGLKRNTREFNIIKIGLQLPRELLYQRIDERMDRMIERGLFEEASGVYQYKNHQALQTVGYKEIFEFIDGKYDKEEAVRLLKRNSRRYAKRQLTWFGRDEEMSWFDARDQEKIMEFIDKQLHELNN